MKLDLDQCNVLKMNDFPGGGCTNPLKCYAPLSCTSLNKSYFYPSVGSHYLRVGIFIFFFLFLDAKTNSSWQYFLKKKKQKERKQPLSTLLAGENLPSNRASIINSLHIYKRTTQCTSTSSPSPLSGSRGSPASSSCQRRRG